MGQTYYSNWIHLIWKVKNQEPLLSIDIRMDLYRFIREYCEEQGYVLDHIGGVEDHVHLLLSLNPKFSISSVVKNIKGNSWNWMLENKTFPEYFSWQDGFAVFSVSNFMVPKIREYIRNQREHHKSKDLNDELDELKRIF